MARRFTPRRRERRQSRITLRTLSSGSTTAIWLPRAFSSSRNFQTAIARRMPSLIESPLRSISALSISAVSKLKLTDKRTKRFLSGFSPGDLFVVAGSGCMRLVSRRSRLAGKVGIPGLSKAHEASLQQRQESQLTGSRVEIVHHTELYAARSRAIED